MLFRETINHEAEKFCTGCGACVQKCNKGALNLVQNNQGYYVAQFTEGNCINCNICENVCPILYPHSFAERNPEPDLYAVQMNNEIRSISSSGGVFSALASYIIDQGGIVFGAAWEEDLSVRHIYVDTINDLDKLRRSKYVQSYVGKSYQEVRRFLKEGKKVLFTGTPCQIAGLNAFLGKDDKNLLTVDVLCLYAPSQGYFKRYLEESFPTDNVVACNMRDKRFGWRCSVLSLSLSNGSNIIRRDYEDLWEQAFLERLMKSEHCASCKFPCHQRQADLTIGDFWEICDIDKRFDNLGTNSVLINSPKGRLYFDNIKGKAKICKKKPLRKLRGNRIEAHDYANPHEQAQRFREKYPQSGFLNSVEQCLTPHYDICLMGCWEVRNFGSHLTYYALYHILKSHGFDVVLVGCPGDASYKTTGRPEYFMDIPYQKWEMQPQYATKRDMREANKLADTFIVGSDQLWDVTLYDYFGRFAFLDFIHDNKKKIAYATSFGKPYWKGSYNKQQEYSAYLKRFDHISVRETSGIDICKKTFGVDAVWNLDPVFLCDKSLYNALANKSHVDTSGDYLAAYILDCTNEKAGILQTMAERLGCKLRILVDPNIKSDLKSCYDKERDFSVEDWLKWIRDSKYVITDSFHGMCVSIKFEKQFIAVVNERRGSARFHDYGHKLRIENRLISSFSDILISAPFDSQINYSELNSIISAESKKSVNWLIDAIKLEKSTKGISDFDISSMRMEEELDRYLKQSIKRPFAERIKFQLKRTFLFRVLVKIKHILVD